MTIKDVTSAPQSADIYHILALLPGMKPGHWQVILDNLDDPASLFTLTSSSLKALGLPDNARQVVEQWRAGRLEPDLERRFEEVHRACREHAIRIIDWCHPDYPESLRHIHGPPPLLYLRGNPHALRAPAIAVVGSRHASRDGLKHATGFGRGLAQQGLAVVSGLALGNDSAAHRGALEADGLTLGVLANGVDAPYPRQNAGLADDILHCGALISELPPGTRARPYLFPQRNRIISGLCRGVLVVEASVRSGSLITARLAMEQGRDVFAIPGSIHNPSVRGCHRLIRSGAVLVETVEDVVTELADWGFEPSAESGVTAPRGPAPGSLDPTARQLLENLGYELQTSDQLCQSTGMSASELLQTLLTLELEGFAESVPGGYRKRAG